MRLSTLSTVFVAMFVPSSAWADYITTFVPGSADPWLAGLSSGANASGYTPGSTGVDTAPGNSPVQVTGLTIGAGTILTFSAGGSAAYGPPPLSGPDLKFSGPDGMPYQGNFIHHLAGPENGISDIRTPINALLGVFLGSADPTGSAAPGALDFSPTGNVLGGTGYGTLSPGLQQVFFIGDGLDAMGHSQQIVAPAGATRLYLGTADGWEWVGNRGGYDVRVSDVPEPGTLALVGIGTGLWACAVRRRAARVG
jgi:PEP-CTERM motif